MRTALCLALAVIFVALPVIADSPAWAPGVAYAVGTLATDAGATYRCLQAHTSQAGWEPSAQPALWSADLVAVPATGNDSYDAVSACWVAWDAAVAYAAGSTVSYEEVNYRNAWWTKGDLPPSSTGVGMPWVAVGPCNASLPNSAPATSAPAPAPDSSVPVATTVRSAEPSGTTAAPATPAACTPLTVADGIELCLPPVVCTAETCPPTLATCVDGECVYKAGYKGLETFPEAWSTYYCTLSTGGCHGVSQINYPEVTADKISAAMSLPICESVNDHSTLCIGIAASSPMVVGNSQVATDPATGTYVSPWGMGMTEASGLCYSITGPGGSAVVALTDRCGGYCKCGGSGFQECGPCVSATDMEPNCPCVGTMDGEECCGLNCPNPVKQDCDWCASNNHPHFDLDIGTFAHVCGPVSVLGSCQLTKVAPVECMPADPAWPPGGGKGSSGNSGTCGMNQFVCNGVAPSADQPVVPDTACCCAWGMQPQTDGSCQ